MRSGILAKHPRSRPCQRHPIRVRPTEFILPPLPPLPDTLRKTSTSLTSRGRLSSRKTQMFAQLSCMMASTSPRSSTARVSAPTSSSCLSHPTTPKTRSTGLPSKNTSLFSFSRTALSTLESSDRSGRPPRMIWPSSSAPRSRIFPGPWERRSWPRLPSRQFFGAACLAKFCKRPVYIISTCIIIVGTLVSSEAKSYSQLFGGRNVQDVGQASLKFLVGSSVTDI